MNGPLFFSSKRSGLFVLLMIVTLRYSIVIFPVQHKLSSVANIIYCMLSPRAITVASLSHSVTFGASVLEFSSRRNTFMKRD